MSAIPKPEVILAQAKALLLKTADMFEADPESWIQGSMARRKLTPSERAAHNLTVHYMICDLSHARACQHCMVGKLYNLNLREPRDHNYGYCIADAAFLLVRNGLEKIQPGFAVGTKFEQAEPKHKVIQFNDHSSTTVTDVIKLLRSAAA